MSKTNKIVDLICIDCHNLFDGKCRLNKELRDDSCESYSIVVVMPEMYDQKVRDNIKDIYDLKGK